MLTGDGDGCPQADGEALSAFPWGYILPVGAAPSQPWHLSTIRMTLKHVKGYYPVPVTPASHLILLPISPQGDESSGVWGAPFGRRWWFRLGQRCGALGVTALSLYLQPGAKAMPDQVPFPSAPTHKLSPASPSRGCTSLHGPQRMQEAAWGGCGAVACRRAVPELPEPSPLPQGMRVPGRAHAGRGGRTMALLKGTSPSGVAKASASWGAGWDLRFGETLQSALTYKQPPHMGSGLQPCSEPRINREASKHPSSAVGLHARAPQLESSHLAVGVGTHTSRGVSYALSVLGGTDSTHIPACTLQREGPSRCWWTRGLQEV